MTSLTPSFPGRHYTGSSPFPLGPGAPPRYPLLCPATGLRVSSLFPTGYGRPSISSCGSRGGGGLCSPPPAPEERGPSSASLSLGAQPLVGSATGGPVRVWGARGSVHLVSEGAAAGTREISADSRPLPSSAGRRRADPGPTPVPLPS